VPQSIRTSDLIWKGVWGTDPYKEIGSGSATKSLSQERQIATLPDIRTRKAQTPLARWGEVLERRHMDYESLKLQRMKHLDEMKSLTLHPAYCYQACGCTWWRTGIRTTLNVRSRWVVRETNKKRTCSLSDTFTASVMYHRLRASYYSRPRHWRNVS